MNWQAERVDANDHALIRESVLLLASALTDLLSDFAITDFQPQSRARLNIGSHLNVSNTSGGTYIGGAHATIRTTVLAAADHLRSFALLARAEAVTVSLSTVGRGAVEALGKARYLLTADDAAELLLRYVSLIRMELKYVPKLGSLTTRDGAPLDPKQYLEDIMALARDLNLGAPERLSVTQLATAAIEDVSPGSDGRLRYSQFSSIAHAETSAVQMFMPYNQDGLVLPRVLVTETAYVIASVAIGVGDAIAEYFEFPVRTIDRWNGRRDIALKAILSHGARNTGG
jgi:hypothetical protein